MKYERIIFPDPVAAMLEASGPFSAARVLLAKAALSAMGCRALVRCASAEKAILETAQQSSTKEVGTRLRTLHQVLLDSLR